MAISLYFSLCCMHYGAVAYLEIDLHEVNNVIALITQLVGGLLILYSIDSTIGILSGASLAQDFVSYLKEFPLRKRSQVSNISGILMNGFASTLSATDGGMPKSVEDQILYLQNKINSLETKVAKNHEELKLNINKKEEQLNKRLDDTNKTLNNIERKFIDVSIGGVKIQILGVVLMIYGSVTSYVG
ncbi:hypothetical protein MT390_06230 [Vibrio sp. 2-Bac 85]